MLDVGCGPAPLWVENRDRIPPQWACTLVDLSPGMIAAARERLGGEERFSFVVADAQELPFGDDEFDLVTASHMLYHVPDRERALRELRRVARDDAPVYVSTVGRDHLRELHELVQGRREAPLAFLLENAEGELRRVFEDVELRRFVDGLEVTEAEALIAVVLSGVAADLLEPQEIAAMRDRIEETIRRTGAFRITKETGVFVCR
jgi:SAM-dependent methyltransferase